MNLTFWVTNDCNYRCKYCYVSKHKRYMSTEICNDIFHFCSDIIDESKKDEMIKIGFHGGEPLLNFDIVKLIYHHFENQYPKRVHYHITTNGSVINTEILNFLLNDNIELCISLDGTKHSNDVNRKSLDNDSVQDKVLNFLKEIHVVNKPTKIRMTVNSTNAPNLFDNFKYIYNLGYKIIVFAPDESDCWTKETLNIYKEQLILLLNYLKQCDTCLYTKYIETIKTYYFNKIQPCNGGIGKYHIDTDGLIYPCIFAVGNTNYRIGSVSNGISQERIDYIMRYNTVINNSCKNCSASLNCIHNRCKIINEIRTGNCLEPSGVSCQLQHIYYDVLKKVS